MSNMRVAFAHVGFGNFLAAERIRAVLSPQAAPTKRLVQAATDQNLLVDMTGGRRTRAVIVLDGGYLALLAITGAVLQERVRAARSGDQPRGDDDPVS